MAGRVVVGIDGSDASPEVLQWALREAKVRGAELDVVFAWRHPDIPRDLMPDQQALEAAAWRTIEEMLEGERARDAGVVLNPIVVHGAAGSVLVDVAKGADLLVVGSRGMGHVAGMQLGSVGLHCVTHASCPVAIVRPQEHT